MDGTKDQRVALITGCGKQVGIGSASARVLAAAGIAVVVSDVAAAGVSNDNEDAANSPDAWRGLDSLVHEIAAAGGAAAAVRGDVSSEADSRRMVQATVEKFGRIDILVNNAGAPHGRDRADLEDVPVDAWDRIMAVNARGVFLMSKAAVPFMRAQQWGRIINISSSVVKYALHHRAAYTASKAAVVGFTQSVAVDLAPSGITVNAICPGSIRTTRAMSTARSGRLERRGTGVGGARQKHPDGASRHCRGGRGRGRLSCRRGQRLRNGTIDLCGWRWRAADCCARSQPRRIVNRRVKSSTGWT